MDKFVIYLYFYDIKLLNQLSKNKLYSLLYTDFLFSTLEEKLDVTC